MSCCAGPKETREEERQEAVSLNKDRVDKFLLVSVLLAAGASYYTMPLVLLPGTQVLCVNTSRRCLSCRPS